MRPVPQEVQKTIKGNRNQVSLLRRKQSNINDQLVQVELKLMNKEIKKPVYEGLVSNLNDTMESVSNEIQDKLQHNLRSSIYINVFC